jgi:hypothetical protein
MYTIGLTTAVAEGLRIEAAEIRRNTVPRSRRRRRVRQPPG